MEALKGLYHADKLDEQSFINNFTIRLKEFHQIVDNLIQQKKKPLQHFLITGKRGMGKSTLLRRIYIEASREPINKKLIAVRLGAEQYRLSRLFKLWEMVIEHLANEEPELIKRKRELEKSKQYEESIVLIIIDYLTNSGKTLLLLIDNFDQFIEKIPSKDQHALREVLMLYPIQVIGNTVFYNDNFKSYNNPFFDFFKPIHLDNLTKEEAEEFIRLRAISEGIENFEDIYIKQKGKINALRILSGGVPRTLLILLSIVSKKNTGDAVDYLNEMIEQVTPLYQDRMKALSAQQQEIMHNLAMRWDKTPVKELAAEMRIPSKSISAQLVQLEKNGYIKKVDVPGRNHYYEIDERFFNIWLLMSEAAPYDTKRVIWLTKWLDAFYSNDELKGFANFCQTELKKIKPGNRLLLVQALSESVKLEKEYKRLLVNDIAGDLKDKMAEVKIWVDNYNRKLTEEEIELTIEIQKLIVSQDFEPALKRIYSLEKINMLSALNWKAYVCLKRGNIGDAEKYFLMAVEKGDTDAMTNLGYLYEYEKKDIAGAEKYYLMAVEKGDVRAMINLGDLYEDVKKDIAGAEKYYLMAVEKGDTNAMFNLGYLYKEEKKDLAGAEKYYLMAVEKGDTDAMVNLGYLYENKKKDIAGAEKYYLMAVEKSDVLAMFNLGNLYKHDIKDIAGAEKYFLMAVEKGDARAMVNLGNLYKHDIKDIAGAEKYYLMAVEKGDVRAMFNLGNLYKHDIKDIASAEKYFLMAAEKGYTDAMFNLGYLYEEEKKDIAGAEKYYLMAVEKGDANAMFNLGYLYEEEKKDRAGAEKYYLMAVEKGDTGAMVKLGNLYMEEKKDIADAEKYYLMAVEKGNTDAMVKLGYLYMEDKKDIAVAEKYFLMAVEKGEARAMTTLGNLYEHEKKDIVLAEKYYLMAVEKNEPLAMVFLANLYYGIGKISEKGNALELSNAAVKLTKYLDIYLLVIYMVILLWNQKVKDASKLMTDILKGPLHTDDNMNNISEALQYFLVFKQKQFLYNLFSSNLEWIDRYKPVYYALLHQMQDEHLKEYLKMTLELEEPVKAVLDFVMKEQKRLGI